MNYILSLILCCFSAVACAWTPYCTGHSLKSKQVVAYLGADAQWDVKHENLDTLKVQLNHVNVVSYAFVRFKVDDEGNYIPNLTALDIQNLQTLRQLRPDLPIMLAFGGWGDRESFRFFVSDEPKRKAFIHSVHALLAAHHLDGIDMDWENELLADDAEINGIADLMQELHQVIGPEGYCLSNAVPATPAYWKNYPDASLWQEAVDWTVVMAYDHYGTFGPRTEHGAALYEPGHKADRGYPYPSTSADVAVKHYGQQGLGLEKMILGVPFYCHSYYLDAQEIDFSDKTPGLHQTVIDPNISSQVSYHEAWNQFGMKLFAYHHLSHVPYVNQNDYGLIPLAHSQTYRFMSCDSPETIKQKMEYILGKNSLKHDGYETTPLGGVAFWSLQQDLSFDHPQSLLKAIRKGLNGHAALVD